MTLNDIKTEWDLKFDEKFGSLRFRGSPNKAFKEYLHARDLAIENAVRAEVVDIIEKICPDYYDTKPTAEDLAVNHVLREILALLTTSPS